MRRNLPILMSLMLAAPAFAADVVTSIPMETDGLARIKESVSGNNLKVQGRHTDENMPGAVGNVIRLDGYSTYVEGTVPEFTPSGASSFSVWVAPETYPAVVADGDNSDEKITIAGTINNEKRSGWAFSVNKYGNYSFDCYMDGWLVNVEADDLLPCYEWSLLAAVNDTENNTLTLYRNGEQVGRAKSLGKLGNGDNFITIGKTAGAPVTPFGMKNFNGLIDEVNVYDGLLSAAELSLTPENPADLSIPAERFAKDTLRPLYHGMPGANWTNETHGMTFSDGKYHVFFQKNANGPYMNRLHWGHLTSDNLYEWTEEKIALAPSESYDIKGTWSGCVFTDDEITGGVPNIIYTGVDYVRAYIAQAVPTDASLLEWDKKGVIINGAPAGLSDDFRDPYFFRNGNDAYIIVGTSKGGKGATTLHKYNKATKTWSNDGSIFFAAASADQGTFWEMPNITPLADGKWLFTCTPQHTSRDVHTLYWIGDINADGTFSPFSPDPLDIELFNGQGYGLLSPTIYQKDGKTIMMGIVPDKLPTDENCSLGWAHLYSFPREIALDEDGNLVQKPYEGLENLRSEEAFKATDFEFAGTKGINGIGGHQYEVKGEFVVGDVPFGFKLFKGSKGEATLTYNPANNKLELNLTKLNRKVNDRNSFAGRYACELPEAPEKGSTMTLDVYVDGSIIDIFVNNKWATSVRVFPTDSDAEGVEAYAENGTVTMKSLEGWLLGDAAYETPSPGEDDNNGKPENPDDTGIDDIFQDLPDYVTVYTLGGVKVKNKVKASEAAADLPSGIYIIEGYKFRVP